MTSERRTLEHRQISRNEIGAWQDAVSIGFMSLPDPATHAFADAIFDHRRTMATFEAGKIVGTYVSFPTTVTLPGGTCTDANAISGVTVLPTHRNRGILRHAIVKDLTDAKERGDSVALLLASEFPIYGRFGFGVANEYSTYEVDVRGIQFLQPPETGSVELVSTTDAFALCKTVFDRSRLNAAGAIERHDVVWQRILCLIDDRAEWKFKGFIAVSCDSSGQPDGFVRYSCGDQWVNDRPQVEVVVTELIASTPQAHLRLWHYLCNMAWVAKVKIEESSTDDDIRLLVVDQRMVRQSSRLDHTWARALDIAKLTTTRTYETTDRVTFELIDDLGFANGTYKLDASPEGSSCKRVRGKPDLTITVNDLSSLVFGGASAAAFKRVGRLDERRTGTAARLDRLFRTSRAPWNPTRF